MQMQRLAELSSKPMQRELVQQIDRALASHDAVGDRIDMALVRVARLTDAAFERTHAHRLGASRRVGVGVCTDLAEVVVVEQVPSSTSERRYTGRNAATRWGSRTLSGSWRWIRYTRRYRHTR
jgi:hypothetical protein